MKKTDLLIIGGSAGGMLAASTARQSYGDIDITMIRETEKVLVPCGIPYIFGDLGSTDKDVVPDTGMNKAGVHIVINSAVEIDRENKIVKLKNGEDCSYKKLIIATGSYPVIPTFIPGYDLDNVFAIIKDKKYLDDVLKKMETLNDLVVIGGGFIGVEFSEQIRKSGKNVTIVEMTDTCVGTAFDKEFTEVLETSLKENGIDLRTGTKVTRIVGDDKVAGVEIEGGEVIPADMVIMSIGVKPNTELARKAGIELNVKGAIKVDQYTRTNDPNIFAVGDCAEKKCFFTGKDIPVLLASTAAMEAKIAGCNVFQLRLVRANKGTISSFATKVFGKTYAAAGLTEKSTKEEGFITLVGRCETPDHHPGSLAGTSMIKIKIVFSKCSGIILGAQVIGGDSACEIINVISIAIQKGMTATELNTFQVATHPLVSAAPTSYPINAAALNALSQNCKHLNEDLVI
ncbi:MAG: FAD-dependent oxidoreductase [Peptostreptococcaceae bacterium]|nr:FAD-dependent oxidoreductase [Peptostreptococcaceae bacterium]